jgi:DinB superfamily
MGGTTLEFHIDEPLTSALFSKIEEQIERTIHLIGFVPEADLAWRPPIAESWSFGEVLGHLLDCLAGLCAVLYAVHPEQLAHFTELRNLPVNHMCGPEEARLRAASYRCHLDQGFAVLRDADLGRKLPTIFVPEGEVVMTLLLGNLEHLVNHKHQLFMYLKLFGVGVGTPELYRFHGGIG